MDIEILLIDLGDATTETKVEAPPIREDNVTGEFGLN